MKKLESNLLSFETHLEELIVLLDINEFIPKLKVSLGSIVNWNGIEQDQKQLVSDFYKLKATPSRSLFNSIYLSAVASFESYLTHTIEVVIENLNNKCKTFEQLPGVFINKHIELTGKILSTVHSPPAHINVDYYKLGKTLGTVTPKSEKIELNTEIAGFIRQLLELDGFISFISHCDIKIDFDTICNDATMKSTFGVTKTRDAANELKAFLEQTKKMRNRIAHTGQNASDMTSDSVRSMINKLRVISKRLNALIIERV
ncbi:MAG: HEPN domain-containing protein [Cyclobacteriaceae bacterium]